MAQLESLDGKFYDMPDHILARYKIGEETVGQLMQYDDLPIAPPPQTGWDEDPNRDHPDAYTGGVEASPFVRTQRGPNNELIINIVLPGAQ